MPSAAATGRLNCLLALRARLSLTSTVNWNAPAGGRHSGKDSGRRVHRNARRQAAAGEYDHEHKEAFHLRLRATAHTASRPLRAQVTAPWL